MSDALQLIITHPGRDAAVFTVDPGIYTIGRDEDCLIHLVHTDIAHRHAILTVAPEGSWIEDLDSESGTLVNRRRIHGRQGVRIGQPIAIGPFELMLENPAAPAGNPAPEPVMPVPAPPPPAPPVALPPPPLENTELERRRSIKQQIHRELVNRLDIKRLAASRVAQAELRERAVKTIRAIVAEVSARLPLGVSPDSLVKEICDEALGLGPLEDFLADPDITEIMVNGPNHVYFEKKGKLVRSSQTFMNDDSVLAIIERIVSPLGRRIDESQPYVDARLPDGSRVNAIIHPLSLIGPCLTIRKFSKTPFTAPDLIRFGTMTAEMAQLVDVCVKLRKNIIVSGGTGSGKTTLLNVLSSFLPPDERIVTIEDAAELRLPQEHVIPLEARPPNIEGRGAITIRDLVRNALRMRPDRIVIGECRGGEALDMLQAMNTGHDGSLTTIHANTPRDVISRMETMVLMSGVDLPVRAIREQIAAAIHLIVHISRVSDGSRKVTRITEIVGLEGTQVTMQDIFEFRQTGVEKDGRVKGTFHPTGAVPTFLEEITARGLRIDHGIFDPQRGART
ncbi:MAG: Flp pilus assembly complex ATPase component TadA [Lentisphaerae bacterium]|nr:Flp pilus assembly complex ATPase component TadA [Lentisphaerota bacterium]